ncbi:UNVERIFIED_CONTAM: hypothetical protein Sradi_5259400 [Sesamum radiatum]|uniref:Retrotransposon Copia-like N-terminal domain-containing protein n=1 Tax=Sesamum radiatum TaxID=300843 RepID=A0AAW2LLE8_SESRA
MSSPTKLDKKEKKEITDLGDCLVSNLLDATNFLSWSRSIKIALGAKMKLCFINGKNPRPSEMQKNSSNGPGQTQENYGWNWKQGMGPVMGLCSTNYKEKSLQQHKENLTVTTYFNKFKKLWDELTCLISNPSCSCRAAKGVVDLRIVDNLMQFLVGLNDSFDHERNQNLMMEPLPNVTKLDPITYPLHVVSEDLDPVLSNSLTPIGPESFLLDQCTITPTAETAALRRSLPIISKHSKAKDGGNNAE